MRGTSFLLAAASTFLSSVSAQTFTNTTTTSNATLSDSTRTFSVGSTILVFARDAASGASTVGGLLGYGIPYELILVPSTGITLPTLNSSLTSGNYGGIIVHGEVSYDLGAAGWGSAITAAQWASIYAYQADFNVRLVRLDVYPGPDFGTTTAIAGAGCCNTGVEQMISISNATGFPTANLKVGAGVSTLNMWHYPATITDPATTFEIAQYAPDAGNTFTNPTTAAVINQFATREQMVFFQSWATDWALSSNFLQHAFIHWMTRGLFVGRRRIYFNTQVDDMHLSTEMYYPNGSSYRATPADLDAHVAWQINLNARLPAGSQYFLEIGHNGNGDIESAVSGTGANICTPNEAIEYDEQIDTALEFMKVVGTGADIWPTTPTSYVWTKECAIQDPLLSWFLIPANRDAFAHLSHTFSHMSLNNATFADANKEIVFNAAWMNQTAIDAALHFSPNGLIPPAITGLHNGDVIKAWMDNGIYYVVGDNTRPVLENTVNEYWPYITTVEANGYAGLVVMPRWATTIYYNCDTPACTVAEWVATSAGTNDFTVLLNDARTTNVRHLLALRHDAFMFHQANMRSADMPTTTVGSQTGNFGLLQTWVETVLQELTRLTTWPIISITHDDAAVQFKNRMALDACKPNLSYNYEAGKLAGVTVTATGNTCPVQVPVSFPGAASSASGGTSEQIGTDQLTIWVTLSGSPVTYTLATPIAV
ncbi:hypothetical protein EG328_006784 [Venturia inaequalis]|uniref:Extracellular serine-rich protein n=1 Tax=Venturia inaequalis TaxID=5025 RepID=A0A8H3V3M3_VENIN|nr:hypothetical protein EG328_006784 [Venturia inaequalis]KAE9980437.1 hypothetical protein EG327_006561 [Venturia inaequalis]RDI80041.1 hypothetical protein Vi05172_g10010 [Venturia inaequalis]